MKVAMTTKSENQDIIAPRPYDFDDDLQRAALDQGRAQLRVLPWTRIGPEPVAVVIGRGGKQRLELDADAIAADGVPLYRRPGGGCSVVLDPGNVVVSLAAPLPGIGEINRAFAAISGWLIDGLARIGVAGVVQRGVSDLALPDPGAGPDRKIGGSCIYRTRGLVYYSTTLLVDPDLDLIERYLPHPPREPEYRAGRDHRAFLGSLRALGRAESAQETAAHLQEALPADVPGLLPG